MSQSIQVFGFIYLQSPDGSIWKLTINNDGTTVTAKVGTVPTI